MISDHYDKDCVRPGEKIRSILDLSIIITGYSDLQIYFGKLNLDSNNELIRSTYVRFKDGYKIIVLDKLSRRQYRYCICKELFHIVLDSKMLRTGSITDLVDNMISRGSPDSAELDLGHATTSETLAELAAQEFLFPYQDREEIKSQANADGIGINFAKLAEHYNVPQYLIERCLNDELMQTLNPFFGPNQ